MKASQWPTCSVTLRQWVFTRRLRALRLLDALAPSGAPVPSPVAGSPAATPPEEPLSTRELEVLRLLAAGMSNPEVAGELVISVDTVRSHCKSIFSKLGVHRRWDAICRAEKLRLL